MDTTTHAGSPRLQAAAESTRSEAEVRLTHLLEAKEAAMTTFVQAAKDAQAAREAGIPAADRLVEELAREQALTAQARATIAYEDAVRLFLAHSVTTGEAA